MISYRTQNSHATSSSLHTARPRSDATSPTIAGRHRDPVYGNIPGTGFISGEQDDDEQDLKSTHGSTFGDGRIHIATDIPLTSAFRVLRTRI